MYWPRLRTRRTASAKSQAAGRHQRGVLAQAVARRRNPARCLLAQHFERRDRNGQQRGLGVLGELELVFRTFETQAGNREAQRLVGLLKNAPRGGVRLGKRLAHASGLRALAGEQKSSFGCQLKIIAAR